jgi:hypothetical protein
MEKPLNSHRVKDGLSHAIEAAIENRLCILSADTAQLSGWAQPLVQSKIHRDSIQIGYGSQARLQRPDCHT